MSLKDWKCPPLGNSDLAVWARLSRIAEICGIDSWVREDDGRIIRSKTIEELRAEIAEK